VISYKIKFIIVGISVFLLMMPSSSFLMLSQNSLGTSQEISFFDNAYADKEKEHEKHDKDKNKVRDELDDKIKKAKVLEKIRVIVSTNNDPENLIKKLGGKILYKYSIIDAVAAEVPAKKIHNLATSTLVSFVDTDAIVHTVTQTTPWGIDRINAPSTWSQSTGSGVQVAILDTGIDPNHDDLSSNIAFGVAFDRGNIKFKEKDWKDKNGHGTHVAGTVAALDNNFGVVGVSPSASLYAVRVLNSQGSGYLSDVIAGIEWSVEGPDGTIGNSDDADIISMSLGTTANISVFHDAVDAAYNNGVVIVAAAGNSGDGDSSTNEFSYPAAYNSVIAVGATDINDNAPWWTNSGDYVEIAAPGVSVLSTYRGNSYAYLSGTSMATPHVSGTVALMLAANPSLNPDEIRAKLHTTATDLGPTGWDTVFGYGLVDAQGAVNSVPTSPPPPSPPSNKDPVAITDSASTDEDTPVTINVVANDNDDDDDSLTVQSVTQGTSGSVEIAGVTDVTYTPNTNFNGADSFTYTISDGNGGSATATVNVIIKSINDAPVANPQSVTTTEGQSVAITLTGSDVDGDSLTFTVTSGPSSGTLSGTAPNLTYSPNPDFNSQDSFTFTASDGALSNEATVSITVNQTTPPNTPPTANDDSYSVDQDTTLTVAAPGVLGNDFDADPLTAKLVNGASSGSLTLNSDGSFSYIPDAGFTSSDTFEYVANDGTDDSSIATVTISVNPVSPSPASVHISSHSMSIKNKGDLIFKSDVRASVDGQPNTVQYTFKSNDGLIVEKIKKAEIKINKEKFGLNCGGVGGSIINCNLSSLSFSDSDYVQVKLELIFSNVSTGKTYSFTASFNPGDSMDANVTASAKNKD